MMAESSRFVTVQGDWDTGEDIEVAVMDVAALAFQEEHTTGMIALMPSEPVTIEGGEPPEESHLTLFFLGDVADIPTELQRAILAEVEVRASDWIHSPEGNMFGAAVWNPLGDDPCVVMNVGGSELISIRDDMHKALVDAPDFVDSNQVEARAWQMPEQHQPWSPHIRVAYSAAPEGLVEEALDLVGPVVFDRVRVALGDEVHDFELGGGDALED